MTEQCVCLQLTIAPVVHKHTYYILTNGQMGFVELEKLEENFRNCPTRDCVRGEKRTDLCRGEGHVERS